MTANLNQSEIRFVMIMKYSRNVAGFLGMMSYATRRISYESFKLKVYANSVNTLRSNIVVNKVAIKESCPLKAVKITSPSLRLLS